MLKSFLVVISITFANEKSYSKKEIQNLQRQEACRVLCIRQGYQNGDYLAKARSGHCRCTDLKEYHQFYSRTMSLGNTAPNEGEKFKSKEDYWFYE